MRFWGPIQPSEFIPIAEDSGLIIKIGTWVLEAACKQLQKWQTAYPEEFTDCGMVVSVNLSVLQLTQDKMDKDIVQLIQKHKISPSSLTLEITETALMLNLDSSIEALNQLSKAGVGISIDDFGTGYSSMSYLKQLPFKSLKIDQSFVQDVSVDDNDAAIVKAIIQLGTVLDLKIIAEGVETKTQLDFLKNAGCHYAQGYYFSKPLTAIEFEKYLKAHG